MVYGRKAVYAGPLALPRCTSGSAQRCHWRSGGIHTYSLLCGRIPILLLVHFQTISPDSSFSVLSNYRKRVESRDRVIVMVVMVVNGRQCCHGRHILAGRHGSSRRLFGSYWLSHSRGSSPLSSFSCRCHDRFLGHLAVFRRLVALLSTRHTPESDPASQFAVFHLGRPTFPPFSS